MKRFKLWRMLLGGRWFYVRPYDNLTDFTHMRYWTQFLGKNEVIIKQEDHGQGVR